MSSAGPQSFNEFWPEYVRLHRGSLTRWLHFCGTTLAVGVLIAAVWLQAWVWLVGVPIIGYGLAWIGHVVFEKNRPATFGHPWWSLLADFKMWALMLVGRMGHEVAKADQGNSAARV